YHPGKWAGYLNHFERDIQNDKTIIILQNQDLEKTVIPKNRIHDILYHIETYTLKEKQMKELTGIYKSEKGSFRIKYENGKLYYVIDSGNEFKMRALSGNKLMASQYLFDVYFHFQEVSKHKTQVEF